MNCWQDAVLAFTRCLRVSPIHPIRRRSPVTCWPTGGSYQIFGYSAMSMISAPSGPKPMRPSCRRRREGLPKSLLEAAACGRPLIASDVPGCREIARHGVNALLVPPDDPEALAHAIATLMNDPDMRIRFGRASRQIVMAEFSSARIGSEIVAALCALASGDRAVRGSG